MTEIAGTVKRHVDSVFDIPGIEDAAKSPEVFIDRDQQATPSLLQEWAQYVASNREFVGMMLSEARHTLDLCDAIMKVAVGDHEDRLNSKLSDDAGALIHRGFAAQERLAHAKVSLVEGRVDLRGAEMQRDRLAALVGSLDRAHREWRANEFTIDRMIRLQQLRLQLAET